MKKLVLSILMLMMVVPCASAVVGDQSHGSAFVPMVITRYKGYSIYGDCHVELSNITDTDVTCTIRVFSGGNEISNYIVAGVQKSSTSSGDPIVVSLATNTLTIPAHDTRVIALGNASAPNNTHGYAVIEWTSENTSIGQALVGAVHWRDNNNAVGVSNAGSYVINNGQPF